MISFNSILKT